MAGQPGSPLGEAATAVGADDQSGEYARTAPAVAEDSANTVPLGDQLECGGLGEEGEVGIELAFLQQEREKVPLRDEGDEPMPDRQMREIGDGDAIVSERDLDGVHSGVGQGEELVDPAEFVQHLQCRRVDCVSAEIAEEVVVLLDDGDIHSCTRQQHTCHQSGGPTADHAGISGDCSLLSILIVGHVAIVMRTQAQWQVW